MPTTKKLPDNMLIIRALQKCQERTLNWAAPKGLLATKDATKQALYIAAEAGELLDGILKDNQPRIMDGIGDTLVTLANYAEICTRAGYWPSQPDWDAGTWGTVSYPASRTVEECAGVLMNSIGHITMCPNSAGLRNRDACRECFTLLSAIAKRYDLTLVDCWEFALEEIEGRTGRTQNGVFVKDAG